MLMDVVSVAAMLGIVAAMLWAFQAACLRIKHHA